MDKYSGCGCCGPSLVCTEATFYTASRWATGTGGTISVVSGASEAENELSLDGPVDPVSFISAEAYQVDFALHSGKVTFSVDGETIVADATNQTIAVGGITIDAGRSSESPADFPVVHLRVTPSFICLFVRGNYSQADSGNGPASSHALLTVDRDGTDPPTTFACTWDSAVVSGLRISSSQVLYTGYSQTLDCWQPPEVDCPYLALKALSQNHLYRDDVDYLQDLYVPDVTLSGLDCLDRQNVPAGEIGTYIGQSAGYFTDTFEPPYDGYKHFPAGCNFTGLYSRLYADGTFYEEDNQLPSFVQFVYGKIDLVWGTPSSAEPYPKPVYRVTLQAFMEYDNASPTFRCNAEWDDGFIETDISANSLRNGFSVSVTASQNIIFDTGGGACSVLLSGFSGTIGATWDLSP